MEPYRMTLWAGLAIGLAFGIVARGTAFCLLSGLRGWWVTGERARIRAFGLALAVAILASQALDLAGLVDLRASLYARTAFAPALILLGGALFAGVALLFIGVGIALREWAFALFPVIHLAVGLGMILGGPILSARERGRTWYTLTDRRAVIATDNWPKGRQIRTWPIGRDTPLELVEGRWPAVHFAYEQRAGKKGLYKAPVGFEMLPEARAVHDIILQNRQGA